MRFLEWTSFQRKYWPFQKNSNYYKITSYSNPYWWIMIFKVLISSLIVYLLEVLTIHQMVWKKNELEKSSSKCDVTFIYLISNKQKFCLTELFVITNYIKYWIPDKIENKQLPTLFHCIKNKGFNLFSNWIPAQVTLNFNNFVL